MQRHFDKDIEEIKDLLLRMGRLVWDNPHWTPARSDRAPQKAPAALAPWTGRDHVRRSGSTSGS